MIELTCPLVNKVCNVVHVRLAGFQVLSKKRKSLRMHSCTMDIRTRTNTRTSICTRIHTHAYTTTGNATSAPACDWWKTGRRLWQLLEQQAATWKEWNVSKAWWRRRRSWNGDKNGSQIFACFLRFATFRRFFWWRLFVTRYHTNTFTGFLLPGWALRTPDMSLVTMQIPLPDFVTPPLTFTEPSPTEA